MSASRFDPAWEFQAAGGEGLGEGLGEGPEGWMPAPVPAPFSRLAPPGTVRGAYRARFRWPGGAPLLLRFEAVATRARVLLNGEEITRHTGAWTPFTADLSAALQRAPDREHELRVEVDATPGHLTDGFLPVIGAAFGGIWQPVRALSAEPPEAASAPALVRARGAAIVDAATGHPLALRGILHWGYYPEHGCPAPSAAQIEAELDHFTSLGFNLVKFCLWVPPREWLEACERRGIWMWQEYPIWDRRLPELGPEAAREIEEMLRRDCGYARLILRTFTCENDHLGAAAAQQLIALAKRHAPHGLALDNSGWLCSEQAGDFHDEHPYLHPAEWEHYPARMRAALERRPAKPLLLGETMSVDTLRAADAVAPPEIAGVVCAARARRLAVELRKHEVEVLRRGLPATGYVMNAARDIAAAPLGFCDEAGRPKFRAEEWAWHRDTMLLAELPRRSFAAGESARARLHVSHFGGAPLRGTLDASCAGARAAIALNLACGETRGVGELDFAAPAASEPQVFELELRCGELRNAWRLWSVPESGAAAGLESAAQPRAGGWRCPTYVWWSPAPWFRPGLLAAATENMAAELIVHDLLSGRVLEPAAGALPLIEVLDLHSQAGATIRRPLVLAYQAADGSPRLVSALRGDLPAGRHLHAALAAAAAGLPLPRLTSPEPRYEGLLLEDWLMRAPPGAPPRPVRAGQPLHFEGFAEFSGEFALPAAWANRELTLHCEAVGDGFRLFVDDLLIAEAGNLKGTWDGCRDRPQAYALRLAAGRHDLRFVVKDWRAGGGLAGPVWLAPTPA